jgi:hypothetical protein
MEAPSEIRPPVISRPRDLPAGNESVPVQNATAEEIAPPRSKAVPIKAAGSHQEFEAGNVGSIYVNAVASTAAHPSPQVTAPSAALMSASCVNQQ